MIDKAQTKKAPATYVQRVIFEGCAYDADRWRGVGVARVLHHDDQFNPDGFNKFYFDRTPNVPMLSYAFGPGVAHRIAKRVKYGNQGADGRHYFFKEFFPTIIDKHIALYSRTGNESGNVETTFLEGIEDIVNLDFAERRLREMALNEAEEYAKRNGSVSYTHLTLPTNREV